MVGPSVGYAQTSPLDLGVVPDGSVLWLEPVTNKTTLVTPKTPCEVCVSRSVVRQAVQDAYDADNRKVKLEHCRTRAMKAEQEREALKNRPGFWAGTVTGATAVVLLVLSLLLR